MRFIVILLVCGTLSACAVAPQDPPAPDASVAPAAEVLRVDPATAVRNFIAAVEAIEPVAEQVCRERGLQADCDFRILVDRTIDAPPNAFQTLDEEGRPVIAFTIPLIAATRNSDELAFILAHEAAHHILGHLALQRRNATIGARIFGGLAAVGNDPEAIRAAQQFGAVLGARTYSKEFELEADALGAEIVARAGFDPLRGAEFFFRIPDPGDKFLGTHPANEDRVRIVQETARALGF